MMERIPYKFKMETNENKSATSLYMYGTVGGGWWSDGITSQGVRRALDEIETPVVNVHLHSHGGDAFEGVAIGHILRNFNGTVNVYNDGMIASAASIIAMGADKNYMPNNTMLMIHRASLFVYGNAEYLRKQADTLTKVDEALIQSYLGRFKGTELELENLLDGADGDGTFMTAQDALGYGFIDEIIDAVEPQTDEDVKESDEDKEQLDTEGLEITNEATKRANRFAAMIEGFNQASQKLKGKE